MAEQTTAANNNGKERTVRVLLKRPDRDPEILEIAESKFSEFLLSTIAPAEEKVESVDYSSTIKIYYRNGGGYFNFGIAFHMFFNNVVFAKMRKTSNSINTNTPCDLSDMEIKRMCAAMGWANPLRKEETK